MEENTKKGLIIGGSIAAVVLLAGGITLGVVLGGKNAVENTISNNDYGIGAFSNLGSFTEDGFNNGVLTSAQNYLAHYENNSTYSDDFPERTKLDQKTSAYSDDGHEYVDMLIEYFDSNDIIISAGFQVSGALMGSAGDADGNGAFDGVFTKKDGTTTDYANSNDKAFVLLDDTALAATYSNAASISFAAEGAGYLSGIAAAVYTEYDVNVNTKDNANIVMWGGLPFNTVYDFMSGFAQAINESNATQLWGSMTTGTYEDITLWSGGDAGETKITAANTYGTADDKGTWYSWGFDAATSTDDGALAQNKTKNAIDSGASIVFPVAGGNSGIAESTLASATDTTTKMVGVDSDATLASTNDDLYIGTAQKNLVTGGQLGLWAMDDFDGDGIRNFEDEVSADDAYGLEITATDGDFETWYQDGTIGAQFRGDINNGGVAFQFGSQTSADMNSDLADAIAYVLGGDAADAEQTLNDFLDAQAEAVAAAGGVESADANFIPDGWS